MHSEPLHGRALRQLALLAGLLAALSYHLVAPDGRSILDYRPREGSLVLAAYFVAWLAFFAALARVYGRVRDDRRLRQTAEAAARQANRLAELTGALAQARTPAAAIEAAIQEPLHALGADAGLLILIDQEGQVVEVVRSVGYRHDDRAARKAVVTGRKTPASDAVGRGAPVIVETPASYSADYPDESRPAFSAIAAIPLLVGSRVVAVAQFEFKRPRPFPTEDREYIQALATRAAQALDRTWQYESALSARTEADILRSRADAALAERQKAEGALRASEARYRALAARTARLHGLAAALSEAVSLRAVASALVQHGEKVVGAASGEVVLLVDEGVAFETLFSDVPSSPATPESRLPVEAGLCATDAVQTRTAVFVSSFDEWQERYARSAAIAADGGYVSSATLPLLVDGRSIGVLAFHFTAPVNFDEEYRALLVSVAQHCSQALDRARLYEEAQRARADAETANRLKDEFVSIVSHDLRTPLNAIVGWTSMLQQGLLEGDSSTRALQSIADNANRQIGLVEDLLDFSRLQSGRMTLEVRDIDLCALLRGVVDSISPVAAGSGLHLDVPAVPAINVRGDARRLEQVFLNLLGNALKFTPEGGRVVVTARVLKNSAEVRVTDTGPGIDPAFLPHMFEAFRQADASSGRRQGGVGLGLSIAKELVEAHHGTIAAETAGLGQGSTFIVTLPASTSTSTADAPDATIH